MKCYFSFHNLAKKESKKASKQGEKVKEKLDMKRHFHDLRTLEADISCVCKICLSMLTHMLVMYTIFFSSFAFREYLKTDYRLLRKEGRRGC